MRRVERVLPIALTAGVIVPAAAAGLYWQFSISRRVWHEGLSWGLAGEALLSWVVQVLFVLGLIALPIALLGFAHRRSRKGGPPTATAS